MAALAIALQALGFGSGDEVIVPGLTWVACASAVLHLGARPVLADIDPATLGVTGEALRPRIGPRTAAVLGVHMYATRVAMPALADLCAERGLPLIEDGSQAHGAVRSETDHDDGFVRTHRTDPWRVSRSFRTMRRGVVGRPALYRWAMDRTQSPSGRRQGRPRLLARQRPWAV